MKIIVLGGDGFCGWPASLRLSRSGHDVTIVDNLSRRRIDEELSAASLTPISTITERLDAWKKQGGRPIRFVEMDVAHEYDALVTLLRLEQPEAVVHLAEQRSAPYSMKSPRHKRYTVDNNVSATHNLLCAVVESELDIHVVHLGTMGVYGYGGGAHIPEGYQLARFPQPDGSSIEREILFPADPGSVYHMTKTLDQLLFYFYNKNDSVRVTDLHQGIVWGTNTGDTAATEALINRFDYDGEYGTVLNRFLVEATIGHPLTVYGTGGQTRAFIHIRDSVECIRLAIENPPEHGDRVRIFNQMTETHRVRDLAKLVSRLTGASISTIPNPRREAEENDLNVERTGLASLGLSATTLESGLLEETMQIVQRYSDRVDRSKIASRAYWNRERQSAAQGTPQVI